MMKTNAVSAIQTMKHTKKIEISEELFEIEKELIGLKNKEGVAGTRAEDCIELARKYLEEAEEDIMEA
jgi:hypothetical protein